ncbi:hypothetical protein DFQ01_12118 [Paenibacillus cellulosilyticus]|uniref:Uncharacterized protein n=1 Tax=Paenibacillus cellulosilyticus TaxID=375489 RepID=A0A2V2YNN1_9BACL|nr:hypothetical protein [Paenibacillus cellulosilyticus]PWV97376.1 hypothetical protein DFQ01_12118 [Paenibacillus cellulosilyticus]QKS48580.1 hypothetical protein HUB94_30585 [Paenibacillus cellulosilyticus]
MRSFALWYSANSAEPRKEATVHINLWDKVVHGKKQYCFDIGLLVEDISEIDCIYLYAPFTLKKEHIRDLGGLISNNQLVNAIFNENYTTTDGEPKKLIVNGTDEKPAFAIYALELESQIKLRACKRNSTSTGTIIEIKTKSIVPNKINRYYFRIRIQVEKEQIALINDAIKGVSIFSNQFTSTEVIDFRLNDVRSCSEELREQFHKGNKFGLLAIHYLILRDANDMIIHYGKEINSRMLENDLWKSYIDNADHNIIAYHIKSKAEKIYNSDSKRFEVSRYIESFSDLSRFQYQKSTNLILTIYILGVLLLGAAAGVLGNWISKLIGL